MDATVDDFFNEINEIVPPKPPKQQKECVWQECYDELTGYSYYWNTKTDEVTWTTPTDFKPASAQKKEKPSSKRKQLYIPPREPPLFPEINNVKVAENSVRIYSIGGNSKGEVVDKPQPKQNAQKRPRKGSESEDEKIELISSYGEDSESESDEPESKISKNDNEKKLTKVTDSNASDDDDDLDILTKIQKRAKELKELGGDLPPEVSNIVITQPLPEVKAPITVKEKKKAIAGFSLVAGYSDSEEEQENEEIKTIFPVVQEEQKVSHSTLFPITKPISVKDFMQPVPVEKPSSPNSDINSRVFQRKRRIGVALVNTVKKKDEVIQNAENERKGFGFNSQASKETVKDNVYSGFKKGGVMFVKSDVLNPTLPKTEQVGLAEGKSKDEDCDIKREDVENMYTTLQEKLGFLSEGRPTVSPVQVMVIQAEMLFTAMKDGALKLSYLRNWLEDTCSELIKLEKDAAPDGWLLQWDRSHKRYYYQNQTTGEGQWEYPQPDINRCDEAMDISTTPPPTDPMIHLSPPLPPIIRSPTPPPPPIISIHTDTDDESTIPDVPLPPDPPSNVKFTDDGEPLPPGVDLPEVMSYQVKEKEQKSADPLYSALDSFYSDIAAIEMTTSVSPPPSPAVHEEMTPTDATEPTKRKKKAKVKLAPGLSMKKKGVSQLVEKWKNVQQHYND